MAAKKAAKKAPAKKASKPAKKAAKKNGGGHTVMNTHPTPKKFRTS